MADGLKNIYLLKLMKRDMKCQRTSHDQFYRARACFPVILRSKCSRV